MEALKNYLIRNFEQVFVLLILVSVASINYLIPYKLAFLNFYFIPILLGAYYLAWGLLSGCAQGPAGRCPLYPHCLPLRLSVSRVLHAQVFTA